MHTSPTSPTSPPSITAPAVSAPAPISSNPITAPPTPPPSIAAQARTLQALTLGQLRQRYFEVFGEGTACRHKGHLVKRILWRVQALAEGGLSERARRRAEELAEHFELRLTAPPPHISSSRLVRAPRRSATAALTSNRDPRLPAPGTVIRRPYKGRALLVRVLPKGFEFEGEVYGSLTAVANEATGSHINGMRFFGFTPNPTPTPKPATSSMEGEQ